MARKKHLPPSSSGWQEMKHSDLRCVALEVWHRATQQQQDWLGRATFLAVLTHNYRQPHPTTSCSAQAWQLLGDILTQHLNVGRNGQRLPVLLGREEDAQEVRDAGLCWCWVLCSDSRVPGPRCHPRQTLNTYHRNVFQGLKRAFLQRQTSPRFSHRSLFINSSNSLITKEQVMLGAVQLQLQHLVYYHSLACLSHVLSCNRITGIPVGTKTSTSK